MQILSDLALFLLQDGAVNSISMATWCWGLPRKGPPPSICSFRFDYESPQGKSGQYMVPCSAITPHSLFFSETSPLSEYNDLPLWSQMDSGGEG